MGISLVALDAAHGRRKVDFFRSFLLSLGEGNSSKGEKEIL